MKNKGRPSTPTVDERIERHADGRKRPTRQKAPVTAHRADRSREHEKAAESTGVAGTQRPPDDS